MLRLNLGCGSKRLPGFVNMDFQGGDVDHDLTQPLPFDDGTVDEVHAYHVAEHFYRWDIERILADWTRVLKPGGKMVLELPCLDKIVFIFKTAQELGKEVPDRLTLWGLYGDPGYQRPEMCHRWCYSVAELSEIMGSVGLDVEAKEPETHVRIRDMRLEGTKRGNLDVR